jgi:hypothetical protein
MPIASSAATPMKSALVRPASSAGGETKSLARSLRANKLPPVTAPKVHAPGVELPAMVARARAPRSPEELKTGLAARRQVHSRPAAPVKSALVRARGTARKPIAALGHGHAIRETGSAARVLTPAARQLGLAGKLKPLAARGGGVRAAAPARRVGAAAAAALGAGARVGTLARAARRLG